MTAVGLAFIAYAHRDALLDAASDPGSVRTSVPASKGTSGSASRSLRIKVGQGGHFYVDAEVDGSTVRFLVDTGASDVVLTPEDAERIGLRPRDHDFTLRSRTAGGIVRGAPVGLRELRIGPLTVRGIDAVVNDRPIGVSLLGMPFLRRLDGYEVKGNTLLLYW